MKKQLLLLMSLLTAQHAFTSYKAFELSHRKNKKAKKCTGYWVNDSCFQMEPKGDLSKVLIKNKAGTFGIFATKKPIPKDVQITTAYFLKIAQLKALKNRKLHNSFQPYQNKSIDTKTYNSLPYIDDKTYDFLAYKDSKVANNETIQSGTRRERN